MRGFDPIAFAKDVKEIVNAIPVGKVATYGDIAFLAGYPNHSRMVGRVLASIGFLSPTPCHRVVDATGRTAPHWPQQIDMLKREGVSFKDLNHVEIRLHRWLPPSF